MAFGAGSQYAAVIDGYLVMSFVAFDELVKFEEFACLIRLFIILIILFQSFTISVNFFDLLF